MACSACLQPAEPSLLGDELGRLGDKVRGSGKRTGTSRGSDRDDESNQEGWEKIFLKVLFWKREGSFETKHCLFFWFSGLVCWFFMKTGVVTSFSSSRDRIAALFA